MHYSERIAELQGALMSLPFEQWRDIVEPYIKKLDNEEREKLLAVLRFYQKRKALELSHIRALITIMTTPDKRFDYSEIMKT